MELGPSVAKLLARAAALPETQLAALAAAAVAAVASGAPADSEALGLAVAVTEAARLQLSSAELRSQLREGHGFPSASAAAVAQAYEEGQPGLRAALLAVASASPLPRLLGCSWRVEHCLGSSTGPSPPLFLLALRLAPPTATQAGAQPAPGAPPPELRLSLGLEAVQALAQTLREALAETHP